MTGDIFIVHRMDKVAASGDIKRSFSIILCHHRFLNASSTQFQ